MNFDPFAFNRMARTNPNDTPMPEAPVERKMSPNDLLNAMLSELRVMNQTSTQIAAKLKGGIVNHVLEVSTFKIPSVGYKVCEYNTAIGSVVVANLGDNTVTVQSGTQSGEAAPTIGIGVQVLPGRTWLAIPIGANSVTIWGTAGDSISFQAFTGMQAYGVAR